MPAAGGRAWQHGDERAGGLGRRGGVLKEGSRTGRRLQPRPSLVQVAGVLGSGDPGGVQQHLPVELSQPRQSHIGSPGRRLGADGQRGGVDGLGVPRGRGQRPRCPLRHAHHLLGVAVIGGLALQFRVGGLQEGGGLG
eukprot:scaffold12990_cov99-Isochrysis_galbana.AAC.11